MRKFFGDPLFHFVLAGVFLFLLVGALLPEETDEKTIVVDRPALLTFIQYRLQSFDEDRAARRLDGLSGLELQALIQDYVTEEALYREARALGLEQSDYVIRRRLVQKLEFMAEGIAGTQLDVRETELRAYYDAHQESFTDPGTVTFTHVFLPVRNETAHNRDAEANALAVALNGAQVPFDSAAQYGERFLYGVNFVDRTQEDLADLFGADMVTRLFEMPVAPALWQGPVRSAHGWHVVLLVSRNMGGIQPYDAARDAVLTRWQQDQVSARRRAILDDAVSRYGVQIEGLSPPVEELEGTP